MAYRIRTPVSMATYISQISYNGETMFTLFSAVLIDIGLDEFELRSE